MSYKDNAAVVKKYLDENDWKYKESDHGHVMLYEGGLGGFTEHDENALYDAYKFIVFVSDEAVQSYTVMPAPAGSKKQEIAEFITRANYGLTFGAFEMDYRDGEVRFHLSFPASSVCHQPDKLMPNILGMGATMLDRYARSYMKVLMGEAQPEEAIREIES